MLSFFTLSLLTTSVSAGLVPNARRGCSTSYAPAPGWSQGSGSVCYDTTYYKTADQGQVQASDLRPKCQSLCTADASCTAVVSQVQYAADSNLATGICFFYNHDASPRQCSDGSKRALYADKKTTTCAATTSTTISTTKSTTTKATTTKTSATTSSASTTRSTTPSTTPSTTTSITSSTTPSTTPTITTSSITPSITPSTTPSSTTTSSAAPMCSSFSLMAQGGNYPGQYAYNEPNGGNAVSFQSAQSDATLYMLLGDQIVQANDNTIVWSASHTSGYAYIYEANAVTNAQNGVGALSCSSSIPSGAAGYPGTITCVGNQQTTFETCSSSLYLSINALPVFNGCTAITLVGSC